MEPQLKPSNRASVVGIIPPQSATTVQSTGWILSTGFHNFLAIVQSGAITASGLIDAKIQQATSSGGAGAKAVYQNNNTSLAAKAITEWTAAANASSQALINLRGEDLDIANGFIYINFSITPSVASAYIAGLLMGFDPRQLSADNALNAAASQVQVVY